MNFIELEDAILLGGSNTTGLGLLAVAKAINAYTAWSMLNAQNRIGSMDGNIREFLMNLNVIESQEPPK